MPRHSRLSAEVLKEVRALHASGTHHTVITGMLNARGIVISSATVYYHLGLRDKRKRAVRGYEEIYKADCIRRGLPYYNRRERNRRMYEGF